MISDGVPRPFPRECCKWLCRCEKVEFLAMTFLTSSISKMDDQYVVLLEKVLAENIRLREVIETRDSEQRKMIHESTSKMARSSNSGPERANRKKNTEDLNPATMPGKCIQDVFNGLLTAYERAMHASDFISVILKQTVFVPESRVYLLCSSNIFVHYIFFSAISRFAFLRCREIATKHLIIVEIETSCGVVNTVNRGKLQSSGNNSLFSEES